MSTGRRGRSLAHLSAAVVLAAMWGLGTLKAAEAGNPLDLIPWPKSVKVAQGFEELSAANRIVAQDAKLQPLARVLAEEIYFSTGVKLPVAAGTGGKGDITLRLASTSASDESYRLTVGPFGIVVEGGGCRGVAWGTVTLLQAIGSENGKARLPHLTIEDQPGIKYRGLLIDAARQWHPVETLRPVIEMCRLYKVNYIQLHLTDDESFTFPSKAFPSLPTMSKNQRRHYTWEELVDLVKYADARGVTLVPEIETPGHSGRLRQAAPFGRKGLGCVNMANEATYAAFDTLIGELCEVFKSSPYIHIGTDESSLNGSGSLPEEKAYMAEYGIKSVHDLFRHHVARLDAIIKKHGKQTMRWGGFTDNDKGPVKLPNDIINMVWEVRGGGTVEKIDHPIINAAWKPLYVVGSKAWLPQYLLEDWNVRLWQYHMSSSPGTTVSPSVPVLGAQMCAWEQSAETELPSLRWRLPAMSERIYNPTCGRPYADYARRFARTDVLLDTLLCPVQFGLKCLVGDLADREFTNALTISLNALPQGTIHFTLDGSTPTASSPAYAAPLTVKVGEVKLDGYCYSRAHGRCLRVSRRLHIKAACFDATGSFVGQVGEEILYAVPARVQAKIYFSPKMFDNTKQDWKEAKDWEGMHIKPDKEVIWPSLVFSMPSASRGAPFVPLCSGVISKGRIRIPSSATYAFLYAESGGEVYIDGQLVTKSSDGLLKTIDLKAGLHDIEVRYTHPHPFQWGTQTLSYAVLKDGQSLNDLLDAPKPKEKWNRPKKGLWHDHEELLVPQG